MRHRLKSLLLLAACSVYGADSLPIGGISHVGFRVADMEKTRAFYTEVLGIQQAYDQKDASGKTALAVFKINDDQFLEFSPGSPAGFTHLAFLTHKLEALRELVDTLGLKPPELRTGRDRTRNFSIQDGDKHRIEFVQYEPDSMQAQARGKFPGRIVTRLDHIGLPVADRAAAMVFFRDKLGFVESKPGILHPPAGPHDGVELLPAAAQVQLSMDTRDKRPPQDLTDPDGVPIHLKTASR
jgi:catechol 2,3-dioxygenase-like lactoylglutathione lyase family enzyme